MTVFKPRKSPFYIKMSFLNISLFISLLSPTNINALATSKTETMLFSCSPDENNEISPFSAVIFENIFPFCENILSF